MQGKEKVVEMTSFFTKIPVLDVYSTSQSSCCWIIISMKVLQHHLRDECRLNRFFNFYFRCENLKPRETLRVNPGIMMLLQCSIAVMQCCSLFFLGGSCELYQCLSQKNRVYVPWLEEDNTSSSVLEAILHPNAMEDFVSTTVLMNLLRKVIKNFVTLFYQRSH